MINQMGVFLAQIKIEELRRSRTPILDYDAQEVPEQPGRFSERVGRLLQAVRSRIITLSKPVSQERDLALDVSLREYQQKHI